MTGILSLVFGIIGTILSYWYVGIFLCLVGLVLGIVGAADYFSEKKFPVAGILISVLGIVMSAYFIVSDLDSERLLVYSDKFIKNEKLEKKDDFMKFRREGVELSNEDIVKKTEETDKDEVKEDKEEKRTSPYWIDRENIAKHNTEVSEQPSETVEIQKEEEKESNDYKEKGKNYSAKTPVFYTYGDDSGDIMYWFVQEITNDGNEPLYLKDCPIDIVDNNGHLIDTENFISSCPDVINPGEKGYFYNSIGSFMLNESVRNYGPINVVSHVDVVKSDEKPIEYEVSDTSLTKNTIGLPSVIGRVTNNTGEDDSLLYLNVIFYNKNKEVIFISGVNVTDLQSGATKSFECSAIGMPDNITYEDISSYEVIARKSHYQF